MRVIEQAEIFMHNLETRKRRPAKASTVAAYRSYLSNWIIPILGERPVREVENRAMKNLVDTMAERHLSASTISGVQNCVKLIVASAQDDNGNELYPRKWNTEFIDAPVVDPKAQKAPGIASNAVSEAICRTYGQFKPLYAILAGTGLRIGEALALRAQKSDGATYWDRDAAQIVVRSQIQRGKEQTTKTAAGQRIVDLSPELNAYLLATPYITHPEHRFIFTNQSGEVLSGNNSVLREAATKAGVPGFHSFRRFRKTHLENQNVPGGLQDFWLGHAGKEIGDRYIRIGQDIAARKEWCQKAGLGFTL